VDVGGGQVGQGLGFGFHGHGLDPLPLAPVPDVGGVALLAVDQSLGEHACHLAGGGQVLGQGVEGVDESAGMGT